MPEPRPERDRDPARCPICGGANACARAVPAVVAGPGDGESAACWCVARCFPAALLALARERDGGAACVCRACLERALSEGARG